MPVADSTPLATAPPPNTGARVGGGTGTGGGRIGPNAILQMLPVLDRVTGVETRRALLAEAGIVQIPDGSGMIDEAPAAALHQMLRRKLPHEAPRIAAAAGRATADYIIANRIPKPVVRLLKVLPASFAAPLLTRAITKHAWTFAGSGTFSVTRAKPLTFSLHDNPVVRGEVSQVPLCHWHAAVFTRLYQTLVTPRARVTETACCACGAPDCTFVITL